MKSIQIPYNVFLDLMRYFCANQKDEHTELRIKAAIEEKVVKMANRERYEAAMIAKTDPERKALLQEYYDKKNGCPYYT